MKTIGKKFMSVLLSLVLVLGISITANAAPASTYSVNVQNGKLKFIQNNKTVGTYSIKGSDITLTTDSDKDFLVRYYDTTGKYRSITLGAQKSLSISGTMNSLTIHKNLDDAINVTLAPASNITKMSVASPNNVTIQGKVGTLSVTAAAKITISNSAKVTKTSITDKKATVTTQKNAFKAPAASPSKAPKSNASSSQLTLKVKPIYAESGDTLSDLLEDLIDNVEAYDKVTKDYMDGTVKWTSARSSELEDDGTFSFMFTPDEAGYDSVKGSIKVYVDSAHGDITLHIDGSITVDDDDTKLKDLTDELNDLVWAEDDEGDTVEGKAKWDSSSNTTADAGRTYRFTFVPKNSKYNKETGSIEILPSKK